MLLEVLLLAINFEYLDVVGLLRNCAL